MKKRLCVLQVTPEAPSPEHVEYFRGQPECDFYFVTHDSFHADALDFCPGTTWVDTRNILAKSVPKIYDYYAFVDYDYILRPQREKKVLDQIIEDLEIYNPAVLTYYPGNGLITPFATNTEYRDKFDYSIIPFTHCGLKIVHHSLMDWFFPMIDNWGGGVEACHLFNILEIPFLKNVVCSHTMLYDNGYSSDNAPHNQDGAWNKYCMDQMWNWIAPSFKKRSSIESFAPTPAQKRDSLLIKDIYVNIFLQEGITPGKGTSIENYLDYEKISIYFDLSHEQFVRHPITDVELSKDKCDEIIDSRIRKVKFSDLRVTQNPWTKVVSNINDSLPADSKITASECVGKFQALRDNNSLFYKSCALDEDLETFLKNKRVAFVGPAPYLQGAGLGSEIDAYDVVVRIQHDILSADDYGSRSDIIQSCLNSNYGPPLMSHLESTPSHHRPKFIICNDTASEIGSDGKWKFVDEVYEEFLQNLDIPFVHLKNNDGTWDRWALYWEVFAKEHVERFSSGAYTMYSANFNSGYGALNYILRYSIKELAVFGLDFYKTGIPQAAEEKYNSVYIKGYGTDGRTFGPDKILHDQLSQIMHCKNVLMKDPRFILDSHVLKLLQSPEMAERLKKFERLPNLKDNTR